MNALLETIITTDLLTLRAAYQRHGFDVRIVGGAVRDLAGGFSPKDVDLCTDATPDEQLEICVRENLYHIPTGLQHGTISIIPTMVRGTHWRDGHSALERGDAYEVTSLRTEADHDGRWASTSFTKDWEGDLARRDLTINAMMLTFDGQLIDPFNGMDDLRNGVVRFVGDAQARIREDYLRILRFFRFNARYGNGELLADQATAIANNVDGFSILRENGKPLISGERIWNEMAKIMTGPNAGEQMVSMFRLGVAQAIALPAHRWVVADDFGILAKKGASAPAMLGLLFSDEDELKAVQKRWTFTADELKLMKWILADKSTDLTVTRMEDMLVDGVNREWVRQRAILAWKDEMFTEMADWVAPVFPLTGDMMTDMGFVPGKVLGDVLRGLRAEWKDSRFTMTLDEMVKKARAVL